MLVNVVGEVRESSRFDRFVAIAAGPANWREDRRPTSADLAAGCLELATLGGILTVTTNAAVDRDLGPGWLPVALVVLLAAILVAVAAPTAWWVLGQSRPATAGRCIDLRWAAARRALGFGVVFVLWAVVAEGVRPHEAWMFGVVLGCEVALGARSVGAAIRPWPWWRRFLTSWGQLAIVAVSVIAAVVVGGRGGVVTGAQVFAGLHFAVAVAVVQCWGLEQVRRRHDAEIREHARAIEQRQHRQRAHWLHDDVCSELRLLRLQLETQRLDASGVAEQLDELDHRLRVRQLDELFQSGRVRLAEVIQPFVRRAQAHGLRMQDVPRYEQGGLELDEHTGRMVKRAAAVLMTNAMQAGATELSIRAAIDRDNRCFELRFDDDAGGFDHLDLPPGRGLDSLRHDLGPGGLELRRTDTGTSARVVFALETPRRPDDRRAPGP